jgi:acyl-CoA reductase-like NAD-dependent aldehyde dehydrogenase
VARRRNVIVATFRAIHSQLAELLSAKETARLAGLTAHQDPTHHHKQPSPEREVMQDEIFGPILPILTYKTPVGSAILSACGAPS